ncbi:aldehyde dehydrogenase family protein [Pseudooceanicola sp. 216_PA32_1]|uniref:aldehyde dehydrogenase (NAD(+)) n=1 Tax=Pseudooceanicola pacificus TaxID=2676438 RepID=A0A844WC09_9RHOB|nr:aldehyde dehydrogenase family protein [Pseudooceanicola pacificus]MWB77622.1 aldehyde dehydrogenase family protein [Pseudooceanicola pacificus]
MTQFDLDTFYIGGEWIAPSSDERIATWNPATETQIGSIPAGTAADVDAAVAAARKAFPAFSTTTVDERVALLTRIGDLIDARADEIAEAITMEMGCATTFAKERQVPVGASNIRVAVRAVQDYPFIRQQGQTAINRDPIGVCGLITPWNWPLHQITAKVGPALAAGCTIVLKPSELSPYSSQIMAEIIEAAGTPAGVFNMIYGRGEVVGEAMSAHPGIDMVSITGSTRAGAAVARAAAPTIKRVTQELGGKSPNVVLDDADFDKAMPPSVQNAFRNMGQSCSAPTRLIVPRSRLAEAEEAVLRVVETMTVGDPTRPDTVLGPVANKAQFDRVQSMIRTGIDEGARMICGGPGRPEGMETGFFVRPTVFSDVGTKMAIAQQEIFGPVLCIIPYEDEAEAVEIANDSVYGLGAQVQSTSPERARRVALQIRSGQVHINFPAGDPMAPFGGYKQSGNGREYGVFGLEEYLETRAILGYFDA